MNWLIGIGTTVGWVVAFVTYVRLGGVREELAAYKLANEQLLQANLRAEGVISIKNAQLKELEEEIDALDTPDSVRARLRRLLSPSAA